jgi:hypothetical protein
MAWMVCIRVVVKLQRMSMLYEEDGGVVGGGWW